MTHTVSVVTVKSQLWMRGGRRSHVRCWQCTCGRIGPEWIDRAASDEQVLRGGRRHVTLAGRRR